MSLFCCSTRCFFRIPMKNLGGKGVVWFTQRVFDCTTKAATHIEARPGFVADGRKIFGTENINDLELSRLIEGSERIQDSEV
jgi:hypothetical protein